MGNLDDIKKKANVVPDSPTNLLKMMPSVDDGLRSGIVMMNQDRTIQVMHSEEVLPALNVSQHDLLFKCYCPIYMKLDTGDIDDDFGKVNPDRASKVVQPDEQTKKRYRKDMKRIPSLDLEQEPKNDDDEDAAKTCLEYERAPIWVPSLKSSDILDAVYMWLVKWLGCTLFTKEDERIIARSVCLRVYADHNSDNHHFNSKKGKPRAAAILVCNWSSNDERLANRVVSLLSTLRVQAE